MICPAWRHWTATMRRLLQKILDDKGGSTLFRQKFTAQLTIFTRRHRSTVRRTTHQMIEVDHNQPYTSNVGVLALITFALTPSDMLGQRHG